MVDQNSPFSYNIRQAFLDYIIEHDDDESFTETDSTEDDDITNNE